MKLLGKITDKLAERRVAAFILIALFSSSIAFIVFLANPDFVNLQDLKLTDTMFRVRGNSAPPKDVVIVAVDEKSINELGRWPWNRAQTGELIAGLKDAKVVALDMVFSEADLCHAESDIALAKAIRDNGNVVLGYFFRDNATEEPSQESLEYLNESKLSAIQFIGDTSDISDGDLSPENFTTVFESVETNIDVMHEGAVGVGSFNFLPSVDGIVRDARLIFGYDEGIYPTLAMIALKAYYDDELMLTTTPYGIDSIALSDKTIPLSPSGAYTLNYYGPGNTFTTYPAVDVIKGRLSPETFKDKMVFVGVTEIGIYDLRPTALDPVYPGVEVHATIAGNVLQERFLIRDDATALMTVLLIVMLPLILGFLLLKVHRTYIGLVIFSALFAVLIVTVYMAFLKLNLLLNLIYPLFALTLSYLLTEAYRNVISEKKSKFYRKAFSTYVPPQLVSEIIRDPESLKLGGTKKVISVLFSDIRGFTTISEKLTPEDLVSLLNDYLSPMTEIVFKEKGTLDKYIGDAIMAIFNAPLDLANHPAHSCSAALNMLKAMPALNREWVKKGYPELKIGLGIHTGEAVVGNMGAELRFDYTAIGDTVNLASRLEGMTKLYGIKIIVSESTYKDCKRSFIFRRLDLVKVKGKNEPVAIYELMGTNDSAGKYAELATLFKETLVDYSKGKFKTAKAGFEDILNKYPDDGPSKLFLNRCNAFIATPPPPDWDGAYIATSK